MSKIRFDYASQEEKDKLLLAIGEHFKVTKISKDYNGKEGSMRRLYVEIQV